MSKAIFFDFDGVLADTNKLHRKAFINTLKTDYKSQIDFQSIVNRIDIDGKSTKDIFEEIFRESNTKIKPNDILILSKEKQKLATEYYHAEINADPYMACEIEKLSKEKKLYITTSGSGKNVEIFLEKNALSTYISGVVTSKDVSHAKPNPEIYKRALDISGKNENDVWVIEDSNSGILSAVGAGIKNIFLFTKFIVDKKFVIKMQKNYKLNLISEIKELTEID